MNTTSQNNKSMRIVIISLIFLLVAGMAYLGLEVYRTQFTSQNQAATSNLNCPADAFRCTFDKEVGVNYTCVINEVGENGKIEVARPEVKTETSTGKGLCTFSPVSGKKYDCTVTAIKSEGCFTTASAETSCLAISLTPSQSPTVTPTTAISTSPTPTTVPGCFDRKCEGQNDKTTCAGLLDHICHDTDPSSKTEFRCVKNPKCILGPGQDAGSCWCQAPSPTPTITPSVTITPSSTKTPTPTPSSTTTPKPSLTPTDKPTPTPVIITLPPIIITSPPQVIKEPPVIITSAPQVVVVPGEQRVVVKDSPALVITSAPQVVVEPPVVITTAPRVVVTTPIPEPPVAGIWDNGFYLLVMGVVVLAFGLIL